MSADTESPGEGSSRRSFLRRMAMTGLVATPVVSSFSLFGGCHVFPPDGGGNSGGGDGGTDGGSNTGY